MSEHVAWFRSTERVVAVTLPFVLDDVIADWASLRVTMARQLPDVFERDEWAYLISFLEEANLRGAYVQSFGAPVGPPKSGKPGGAAGLIRPRGPVAVWLPNNVSLLGPLVMILISITGNPMLLKGGSRSEDLTGAFLQFAIEHLREGPLREALRATVRYDVFDRDDARNAEFAAEARSRIIFGSDAAAASIEALPHPQGSTGFAFIDRRSEAWVERELLSDELVDVLIKVFAIYGQAGCTSPRRVVVLDGTKGDALELRDRMLARWPEVIKRRPAPHVASACVMARQWAAALGWDARLAANNGAVLATGEAATSTFESPMGLPVVAASVEAALDALPPNIQTIGHAVHDPNSGDWLARIARSGAKRFVPVARMHHFGPVWDGVDFWRQTFEEVEVGA